MSIILPVSIASALAANIAKETGKSIVPMKLKNIGAKKKAWLDSFIPEAKEICEKNEVPFQVCVAQAALESGWGAHAPGYNYFGIKGSGDAGSNSMKTHEILSGKKVSIVDKFAKFSSIAAGIQGYCNTMKNNKLFSPALDSFPSDPAKFALWIWAAGYATAPSYVDTLIGVMNTIYRATGDDSFKVAKEKSVSQAIAKLKSKKYGKERRIAASKMLNVEVGV